MRWFHAAALVFAISCNSKKSAPETSGAGSSATTTTAASSGKAGMSKFTVTEAGDDSNKVNVEFAVPSSWQTDSAGPAPSWKMDGARMLSLATISPRGSDNAARVDKAIKQQDLADGTRNDYPDGRVFVSKPDGANIHARMFVPYAGGVLMGIAVLSDKSKLDGVKAAFETIKIAQ